MTFDKLLSAARSLDRAEKLRLIGELAGDLYLDEKQLLHDGATQDGGTYEVWSPYDAYDAAIDLERFLTQGKSGDGN